MMQSRFIYHPRFLQNDSGIYYRYNNYQIPNKGVSKTSNYNNYLYSVEKDSINYQSFKLLTDKNISPTNQEYLKLLFKRKEDKSFQSSQNYYKQFNYLPKTIKQKENNNNKNMNIKNDLNSTNNNTTYISLYNRKENIENIDLNSNNIYNLYVRGTKKNKTNNNIFNQDFSSLVIDSYNQKKLLNNSSSYNIKHDSYNGQFLSLMKHKNNINHILIMENLHKPNNLNLNKKNNNKNEYEEKSPFNKINKDIHYESKQYNEGIFNSVKEGGKENINGFYCLTDRQKLDEVLIRNMTNNCINNVNDNIKKIVKKIKTPINNDFKKKESKAYKSQKNKNIDNSKIENFEIGKAIIKKENKKNNKLNLLNKYQNTKNNNDNKNNNSFLEIKSISKGYESQKNLKTNTIINKEVDKSELKFTKMNSNIIEKINNDSNTRKVNLNERQNFMLDKKTPKNKIEFLNKSAKNIKLKLQKNKNNYNNTNPNIYKNDYIIIERIKDNIPLNNNYMETINPINKYIFNGQKNKNNNNHFIDNNINMNSKGPSLSKLYSKYLNSVDALKINSNYFTYSAMTNNNNILKSKNNKKYKKFSCKKNFMLLQNINNKTFEEDFFFKKKDNKNNFNNKLIPQISFRIALLAIKKPEIKKYFTVNKFYSQNIRDKPGELESDF